MSQAAEIGQGARLIRDLPMHEYLALDAASRGVLWAFRHSALHARHEMLTGTEDTKATLLSSAVHTAVLEPDRFAVAYGVSPPCDRRTKVGKALWAEWTEAHPSIEPLKQDEFDMVRSVSDAVLEHPTAGPLMRAKGLTEPTLVWVDEESGLPCKTRPDRLVEAVVDLKAVRFADHNGFAREVAEYGWHVQAAMQLDGLDAASPHPRRHLHVAAEKEAPFAVAVYELTEDAIKHARALYRGWLLQLAECKRSGQWPGYPVGVNNLHLPNWAVPKLENQ